MLLCGCDTANSQVSGVTTRPETETTNVTNQTESKMMTLTLNNGVVMPQFGLGVYSIPAGEVTYNSVLTALKCGYRHIDTAHAYQNERSVGQAVKDSGISRDSIWITSKLWPNEYGEGKTLKAIDRMLGRLGLEYIDLVYFHQPIGDYVGGWKEMEQALESGKVRAIGISNFDVTDSIWNSLVETARIKPQIVQIECHPYAQRRHWQEMAAKHHAVVGIEVDESKSHNLQPVLYGTCTSRPETTNMWSLLARLADETRIDGYGHAAHFTEVPQGKRDVEAEPVDALRTFASEVLAVALFAVPAIPAQLSEIYLSWYNHV